LVLEVICDKPSEILLVETSLRMHQTGLEHDLPIGVAARGIVDCVIFELGEAPMRHNIVVEGAIVPRTQRWLRARAAAARFRFERLTIRTEFISDVVAY